MHVSSENNPFDVLANYDPKTQNHCVEKKDGKQILTAIDRKEADSIPRLVQAQQKNEQAILVRRYGTEDAKKLRADDVNVFFEHNRAADLFNFEKSGKELTESLEELKRSDRLKEINKARGEVDLKDYKKTII